MAVNASDWVIHFINAAEGQMGHHGDDVCGGSCVGTRRNFYFIPTVGNLREGRFFVPARTLVGLKPLTCPPGQSGSQAHYS